MRDGLDDRIEGARRTGSPGVGDGRDDAARDSSRDDGKGTGVDGPADNYRAPSLSSNANIRNERIKRSERVREAEGSTDRGRWKEKKRNV